MVRCKRCDKEFTPNKAYEKLCEYCRQGYVYCDCCKQVRQLDAYPMLTWKSGAEQEMICAHCIRAGKYKLCGHCRLAMLESEAKTIVSNGGFGGSRPHTFCPKCMETVRVCESCRDIFMVKDLPKDKDPRYCRHCHSDKKIKYFGINGAGFRPIPVFFGEPGPWYGIELEVDDSQQSRNLFMKHDCETDLNKLISSTKGAFYMKSDGSLSNGFEIVSQPHTLDKWRETVWLKEACEIVKSNHGSSFNTRTCGLHVHRSRYDLTDLHLVMLVALFVRLQPFFERIAQRKENGYCYYAFYKGQTKRAMANLNGNVIYKAIKDKTGSVLNRYQALNITGPATVECRIFKGTLCSSSVIAYISFMHWLCEFVKQKETVLGKLLKMSIQELWGTLGEFFTIDPLLTAYLQEKKVAIKGTKASDKMRASGMFQDGEPSLAQLNQVAQDLEAARHARHQRVAYQGWYRTFDSATTSDSSDNSTSISTRWR